MSKVTEKNGHCFLIRYITFPFVFIWRFVWTQLQCWNLLYLCHKDLTNVYGCMLALCRVSALKHERKWGWGRMCFKAVTSSTVSMDCWHNKFQCHKCSTVTVTADSCTSWPTSATSERRALFFPGPVHYVMLHQVLTVLPQGKKIRLLVPEGWATVSVLHIE